MTPISNTADIVVIGGGVMGSSITFHLSKRRAGKILLLERTTLGAGSTGRSSGVIRMHYSTEINSKLAHDSLTVWQNWSDYVGEGSAGWTKTGFMIIANHSYQTELEAAVSMQRRVGIQTKIISPSEAREFAPHFKINNNETIAWESESGYGDPSGAALGFAAGARRLGAETRLGSPALSIELKNDRVTAVITENDRIETPIAVVATGPWSPKFLSGLDLELPLQATRHEVFILRRQLGTIDTHPGGADIANLTYFRPEASDLTLVGNGNAGTNVDPDKYDAGISMEYLADIWHRLSVRIPAIASAEFTRGYAGLYTETPDSHPIVDSVRGVDGLYVCTGFSGHGFKMAPAIGNLITDLILDGESSNIDIRPLRMSRFAENELNDPQTVFRVLV